MVIWQQWFFFVTCLYGSARNLIVIWVLAVQTMSYGLTIMSFTRDCGSYLWWWWPLVCLWLSGTMMTWWEEGEKKEDVVGFVYGVWGLLVSEGTFSKATSVAPKGLLLLSQWLFQKSRPTTIFSKVTTQSNTTLYPKHDHLPSSRLVCCFLFLWIFLNYMIWDWVIAQ
jgi:hypothetical protein